MKSALQIKMEGFVTKVQHKIEFLEWSFKTDRHYICSMDSFFIHIKKLEIELNEKNTQSIIDKARWQDGKVTPHKLKVRIPWGDDYEMLIYKNNGLLGKIGANDSNRGLKQQLKSIFEHAVKFVEQQSIDRQNQKDQEKLNELSELESLLSGV